MTKNVSTAANCVTFETSKIQLLDIKDIIGIANICFTEPWSYELFVSEINSQDSICLKVNKGARIIAYIIARYFVDELHIMHLAVLPDCRRTGVAEHLVAYLLKNYPAQTYLLEVRESNKAATGLYQKLGFIILSKRKNYYSNGEDAIVMTRGNKNA
jgi:[ribosomal protein S18]-alanine N-acetyltransferase